MEITQSSLCMPCVNFQQKVRHKNSTHYMKWFVQCNAHRTGNPAIVSPLGIAISASVLLLLLLVIAFLCFFKKRRTRRRAEKVTKSDGANPSYGDYPEPDPRMEVEDRNAYILLLWLILNYSFEFWIFRNAYYSSDYEAGAGRSRATDNNPYYE